MACISDFPNETNKLFFVVVAKTKESLVFFDWDMYARRGVNQG